MDTNWPRCNQTFRNRPTRLAKGGIVWPGDRVSFHLLTDRIICSTFPSVWSEGGTNLWIDQGRITPCPKNCFAGSRVETGASFLNRSE